VLGSKIAAVIKDGVPRLVLEEATRARGIQLADFLRPFQERYWPGNLESMHFATYGQLVAMLLACLPNLTSLVFPDGVTVYEIPQSALRAAGISTLPLRTVEIFGGAWYNVVGLDGLLNMASSTLRTLNIVSGRDGLLQTLATRLRGLRSLCITNCVLNRSELGLIFSRCEGLESFI
jgi:hypothetical protein